MSFDNIQNYLKNQNISWDTLNQTLKEKNADRETIAKALSIFQILDKNNDKQISKEEWANAYQILNSLDKDQNGTISNNELSSSKNSNVFKQHGADATNTFLNAMSAQADNVDETGQKSAKSASAGIGSNLEHDENGNLITYPKEGETFKKTAERLGFKEGTPEYEEFVNANKASAQRNWFKVGDKVKIPPSIQDKVNQEGLLDETAGKAEVQKYNELYGQKPAAASSSSSGSSGTENVRGAGSSSSKDTVKESYPQAVQNRINELQKSGDTYEVTKDSQGGYSIKITAGRNMSENKIGEIEIKYDSAGNLLTQTQKYNNGRITETSYTNGSQTKEKASPAPEKFQKIAADIQAESGGNARVEYNETTGHYEIIQTNLNYKDVKEIRTVLSDKSWQEEMTSGEAFQKGLQDAWDAFSIRNLVSNPGKAINAGLRNRNSSATKEDYYLTQTTTYNDGRVIEGTYKEGKLKKNTVLKTAMAEKPEVKTEPEKPLKVAADISFKMPEDAPENAKKFASALVNDKEILMRQLGIDNDTYNTLAQTAIGIAGKETNFGEQTGRQTVKDILRGADSLNIDKALKNMIMPVSSMTEDVLQATGTVEEQKRDWSYGMTQLKYTMHIKDPAIKRDMEALGITNEKQLLDPEVSAKATMVLLAHLNKRLDTAKYQQGMETAQDTIVQYNGWEINEEGIAEKTGNTEAWANNITRQDALCALWNGGEAASLLNGTYKPQGWEYSRKVREITQEYKLVENADSRKEAEAKAESTRTFDDMKNNGEMGGVVFLPAMYTDKAKHLNTPAEIKQLNQSLSAKGIDSNLRQQLVSALQNGELSFDFGLSKDEIESLTNSDIKLLLMHLKELKSKVNSNRQINTSDGINSNEASILRNNYAKAVGHAEDKFRKAYLNNHSAVYNASASNKEVLRETNLNGTNSGYVNEYGERRGFKHEKPQSVSEFTTRGRISEEASILANAGYNVAMKNPNNITSGYCLTGVKEAMSNAGIDVSEMAEYGSQPKYVKNWFEAHPEMFTPVKYVETGAGIAREINTSDLSSLPAGYIVIWTPGEGYENEEGHIAITNGNGQGYADATDNLQWANYHDNRSDSGKGEHGSFVVYKLSDNWEVDKATGKIRLKT